MKLFVNDKELEVSGKEPLIEILNSNGYDIPSLCYSHNHKHQASCMVCMVRNADNGQMIPSCSTFPYEGMRIETDTDEVKELRKVSLELLLSDHRADCEAPCSIVCPKGLDPAQIILYYDRGQKAEARSLLMKKCNADSLPCKDCKAPCEKACRRGTIDKCVNIREIISSLVNDESLAIVSTESKAITDKSYFNSKSGRYSDAEKEWAKQEYDSASRCLQCACEGRDKCKLRSNASKAGIKSSRYGVSSALPFRKRIKVTENIFFEPAKCIRCGLCVYNTSDGFTFLNRGFDMQVIIPEESKQNIGEEVVKLCPTGAIYKG